MGKKGKRDRQASMWVATADLPKSAGHPFYAQLNRVLDDAGFDTFVEAQCAQFYADGIGRPSLAPGRYFRLLLLGYFEGLDSERAIAWRAADSLSIRQFLDFALHEAPPDHSTLSRTRRLIDVETHQAVFTWVLQRLADAHLVEGHTIGIDATTLEANAAMRSIVRRDTGEAYEAWLTRLAEASGIATPTRVELARFDRKRKKKGSNEDWTHPPRSRCEDHEDEGRPHASGAHRRARGGSGDGRHRGGDRAGRRRRRHHDDGRHVDRSGGSSRRGGRRFGESPRSWATRGITATRRWLGLRISASGAMCRSLIAVGASGRARRQPRKRCMPTGGGFEVIVDNACCGSAANGWNGPTRISTRPGACAGCICAAIPISSNACSCTSVASTSGCSCGS